MLLASKCLSLLKTCVDFVTLYNALDTLIGSRGGWPGRRSCNGLFSLQLFYVSIRFRGDQRQIDQSDQEYPDQESDPSVYPDHHVLTILKPARWMILTYASIEG